MGGGLLQLVAQGAQDAYLSGNPQITFWKGLFKRHTNFAMEPFRINLTGQAAWGTKHSAIIPRKSDLLYSTYLEVVLAPGHYNNDGGRLGYNLLKYVELDIGGNLIDRLYGEWLFLWDCLTSDVAKGHKLAQMVGSVAALGSRWETMTIGDTNNCANGRAGAPEVRYIPLPFFYTRNPGAALPLIALAYHEVKINILWNDVRTIAADFTNKSSWPGNPTQAALYIDYIYLDVEERRRMAQESHEYLIEQVQYNEDKGITTANNRIDLTFNHPVKELVWVVQPSYYTNCSLANERETNRLQPFTYDKDPVYDQWLQINGQDRMERRFGSYYNLVQPFQHHTGSVNPIVSASEGGADTAIRRFGEFLNLGIYMYSFALKPEENQPSGTCNFSRIDTSTLVINFAGRDRMGNDINVDAETNGWDVRVYAVNYNILRIMSGMAGLAYAN
jgi:hypothetical protein